ncbi:MAG: hypothetical protein RIS43_107, partial [Actinomycetota bacterium]
ILFGMSMNKMAAVLDAENALAEDTLPRTIDGRIDRDAADAQFEVFKAGVESDPDSWRAWYRLAIAYDDSRDRRRARTAMRTAEKLFKQQLQN